MYHQDLISESTLWTVELMKFNQVLLCHYWSVSKLFICIASMMLRWVQAWALTNQSINIHQYKIHHTDTRDDQRSKKPNLFYTCFEPLLMLGRQSTSVLIFFNAAFFCDYMYLFIINVSSVNHCWTKKINGSKKNTQLLPICEKCLYLMYGSKI